nr:MAG TPA: minor tail protein [Caudoviricetes sp.]
MANKDIKLAIRIAGEIDKSLDSSVKLTKKQIRSLAIEAARANQSVTLGKAVDSMSGGIDSVTHKAVTMTKMVSGAAVGSGVVLAGVGTAAAEAGSDFESAFAGIRKTVDATEQQYDALEDSIRSMSKNMPMAATELAGIGEAAGQLGVQTENLEEFIQTMADLSVATNLTSEEGAAEFAKFANIVKMPQDKFDELGSTVVALGNNMATTEADIVSMGMRLAGAGEQVGMNEADIMGLSAALSSVGIEAEMGGSAMSKVMINMQLAVETGNESLKSFAHVAGMSADEFARAYKEDAANALIAFLSGLNDTERLGMSAIAVLDEMEISEVRLRDTLLRAAGASDLFDNSIELANEAFEENTALSKEASQRYATFESRLEMTKNRVNDVGISLYQNFRDPLNDVLGLTLDVTDSLAIFDEETIQALSESAREHIPTAVREIKEGANVLTDFAGPVMGTAINNLDLIGSGIVGIGAAIVTLNVIKKVNDMSKAFGNMKVAMMGNPWTLAVGGMAALVGVISAVRTKLKLAREDAKKANLERHFGEIALSMGEVEEIAEKIVDNGNLDHLNQFITEMGKTQDAARNIHNLSEEINKITWKVGTGFELSETDKDTLKESIESMAQESISLVEQSNYTATVSVQALFGTDSEAGRELITGFNAMYAQINGEVETLGRQLGDAYSTALEDGVIDMDEAKIISELQGKLARITAEVSQSQFEAKMDRITMEHGGMALTAESLQNVQAEINEVTNEQMANQRQSLEYALGQLNLQREKSLSGEYAPDSEAYLSPSSYADARVALENQFNSQQMEISLPALQFSTDSITSAYKNTIDELTATMGENTQTAINEILNMIQVGTYSPVVWEGDWIQKQLGLAEIDSTTKDAITELWEGAMQEQFSALQELVNQAREKGQEVPEAVSKGLSDAAVIGAIAGDTEAIWQIMADATEGNEEYEKALKDAEENGLKLPEAVSTGIGSNQKAINDAVNRSYEDLQRQVDRVFSKGIQTDLDMYLNLNPIISNKATEVSRTQQNAKKGIPAYAEGGILSRPHIGLVAEDGPEAIIPLDGSTRAKSIWQEAGELLGITSPEPVRELSAAAGTITESGGGDTYNITYAPVLQGASQAELERAARSSFDEFEQHFDEMIKKRRRLSYR